MSIRRNRGSVTAAALSPAVFGGSASHAVTAAAPHAVASAVTVNATAGLGAIPSGAIGLNTAVYDQYMNDGPIPSLVKAAGIDAMRYPGGSYSDIYDWQTNVATASTSTNLSGLTIGDSYTYTVIAVDAQGNQSLPSPPVTFTVPAPANSPCAVHYAVSSTWSGGFGAAITITHRAATATSSWTLTWTWPATGEAVSSGWDGTFTQSGLAATVTNASWNGVIAANGGSASIGFNGSDTGQIPSPTVFELNGTVCSDDEKLHPLPTA